MHKVVMGGLMAAGIIAAQSVQVGGLVNITPADNPSPVAGAPYSAEAVTTTTHVDTDGKRVDQTVSRKMYRDSQGRTRQDTDPAGNIVISDPGLQTNTTLDPRTHTARTAPAIFFRTGGDVPLATVQPGVDPQFSGPSDSPVVITGRMILPGSAQAEAPVVEQLGTQVIEGVAAQGTRRTVRTPSGPVVDETWYSPDLHLNVMTRHSDPSAGETTYRLTNIKRAEPDPALFQVPQDYRMAVR